ncbi:carbohydrate ABC transporter permease [Deinococcus roseus]|uniref:Alpha-glucoside ABC transporter permease n=1 Tax=Deinococcus roseus TaxID=392414 RepID=A0ABQ2CYF6_9DEIO|nr:sugar ABC transporter permease [Deinococcus roseus]GGJ31712.1 alpha-glucoside ABC transporter permease [Deinococcus roseus]
MLEKLVLAFLIPVLIVGGLLFYLYLGEALIARLPRSRQGAIRPWIWLSPALLLLVVIMVWPLLQSFVASFQHVTGDAVTGPFVGIQNYITAFTDPQMLGSMVNNLYWIVFFTGVTVCGGLALAVLVNRVKYGGPVKTILFMPMAISFVATGVIWRFMYAYRPEDAPQIGTLNAVVTGLFHIPPVAWIFQQPGNNLALIVVGVWMFTGFCLVILNAGLRSLPEEVHEAARVDGATEWQVFSRITVPLLAPTISVVATTMVINALKMFDIVYVMTAGNFGTDVIANQIYKQLYSSRDLGMASTLAVILLVVIFPFMVQNVRRFHAQENR